MDRLCTTIYHYHITHIYISYYTTYYYLYNTNTTQQHNTTTQQSYHYSSTQRTQYNHISIVIHQQTHSNHPQNIQHNDIITEDSKYI